MRRRSVVVALAVLVGATGCGDDGGDDGAADPPAPEQWVAEICGGLQAPAASLAQRLATISDLPDELEPDEPLGDRLGTVQDAFAALPIYLAHYTDLVEVAGPPDIPDGAAFQEELLAQVREARQVVSDAAASVGGLRPATTPTQFFRQVEGFAGFDQALSTIGLDLGDEVPPEIADAVSADVACRDVTDELAAALT
jgi:hypothetical protein